MVRPFYVASVVFGIWLATGVAVYTIVDFKNVIAEGLGGIQFAMLVYIAGLTALYWYMIWFLLKTQGARETLLPQIKALQKQLTEPSRKPEE